MSQTPKPRFKVGDVVRVVEEPYFDCPFGWAPEMNKYCGLEAEIIAIDYGSNIKTSVYILKNIPWRWCENCFEPPDSDIKESDADIAMLFV